MHWPGYLITIGKTKLQVVIYMISLTARYRLCLEPARKLMAELASGRIPVAVRLPRLCGNEEVPGFEMTAARQALEAKRRHYARG